MGTPSLITMLNVTALVALRMSLGLQVELAEVLETARPVPRIGLALLANSVLVPAVMLGLPSVFRADPLVAAGFLILAACPGAPVGPPRWRTAGSSSK